LEALLRTAAMVASAIVLLSFTLHSRVRQATDVRRGAPTVLAVLLYSFGLSFLARYSRGRA
jgi:hypothetical protein